MEKKNMNSTEAAGNSAAFVLSDLRADDVWQMVRVLKKLDLASAKDALDADVLKKAQFKSPTMMKDGKIVPLPIEKWTPAQKKAYREADAAKDAVLWQILGVIMDNIPDCKDDINKLLAMGCGCEVDDISGMDAIAYVDLIAQYVTRDGFKDFFTHALNLVGIRKQFRAFTGTAET